MNQDHPTLDLCPLYPKPGCKGPFYQFPLQGTGGDQ